MRRKLLHRLLTPRRKICSFFQGKQNSLCQARKGTFGNKISTLVAALSPVGVLQTVIINSMGLLAQVKQVTRTCCTRSMLQLYLLHLYLPQLVGYFKCILERLPSLQRDFLVQANGRHEVTPGQFALEVEFTHRPIDPLCTCGVPNNNNNNNSKLKRNLPLRMSRLHLQPIRKRK